MLNVVALMGRLTADPELKQTQSGVAVVGFTIACDRNFCRAGEQRQTDFINIVAWQKTAEFVCKWFQKGSLVAIDGSIQMRAYQDKNGNRRTAFEIIANNVNFAGGKKDSAGGQAPAQGMVQGTAPNDPDPAQYPGMNDDFAIIQVTDADDLPF